MIYREYEKYKNSKRLVLEIIFRESDGKMKSVSGIIKATYEPKGGFRNWCKEVAAICRKEYLELNYIQVYPEFGWHEAEIIRTKSNVEFSRKHPHGFVGIIQHKAGK